MQGLTEEQKIIVTQRIMGAVDDWGLSGEQILAVLDFPESERSRHLQRYRKDTAFPESDAIAKRVLRLMGIIDALRTTYPRNAGMGPRWMNTPHRRLSNRTPIHAMLEDGESGVIAVLSELDCVYAWELSGSNR